ncbi:MAG: pyridoxamine 5'-phosphate oxidase [Nocardioides sp.]
MQDPAALRREYADHGLVESDLDPDPVAMFGRWFDEATEAGIHEPNAMVLSTVSGSGQPSSRMVLLKGVGPAGLELFTNLGSRKGEELLANPRCALLFPWHPLERQVRIEGTAGLVPRERVEEYFASRPRRSMLGAHASPQSRPVADRAELQAAYEAVTADYEGQDVPVPEQWGGFLVRPESWEFWQGRPGRMHDRLVYRRSGERWRVERLAP